jgi:hypothetical protein
VTAWRKDRLPLADETGQLARSQEHEEQDSRVTNKKPLELHYFRLAVSICIDSASRRGSVARLAQSRGCLTVIYHWRILTQFKF